MISIMADLPRVKSYLWNRQLPWTIELTLNNLWYERQLVVYRHFSLSSLIFHVYFMANLSNAASGQILGILWPQQYMAATILSTFFTDWYPVRWFPHTRTRFRYF